MHSNIRQQLALKKFIVLQTYKPKREEKKKRKAKRGSTALRKIRFYQKQHDCHYFQVAPFKRMVKRIMYDFSSKIRISSDALALLQFALEDYLVRLLEHCQLCAIHAGRIQVKIDDLQLVMGILGQRA